MTIHTQDGETYLEHGTPGEPGHWRVLYIKWADGTDNPDSPGVSIEKVLDALLFRIHHVFRDTSESQEPADILRKMLDADKYNPAPNPDAEKHQELQAAQDAHPDQEPVTGVASIEAPYQQEYPTGDELASQGLDAPPAAAPWTSPST